MKKPDIKDLVRFSNSGALNFLRISTRVIALPSLAIYPTSACNYDCMMCPSRRSNLIRRALMEFSLMESLLKQCERMAIKPRLHFSGLGEPLIYPQISRVMEICRERGLTWSLTTNGLALKQHAAELVANDARGINLSLHGTPSEHDRITNTPGSWQIVTEGLACLAEEKRKQGKTRPLVALNCVVTNDNVLALRDALEAYTRLPISSVTFQHLTFSQAELAAGADHLVLDPDRLQALIEFTDYVQNSNLPIKCNIYPHIGKEDIVGYYTAVDHPFAQSCVLPWLTVRVMPNGDVGVCDQILGSLRTDSLKAIINGKPARDYRNQVRTAGFSRAVCFRCCHRQYYESTRLSTGG